MWNNHDLIMWWCHIILSHYVPPLRNAVLRGRSHFTYFCEIRLDNDVNRSSLICYYFSSLTHVNKPTCADKYTTSLVGREDAPKVAHPGSSFCVKKSVWVMIYENWSLKWKSLGGLRSLPGYKLFCRRCKFSTIQSDPGWKIPEFPLKWSFL